jgi:probable F420-dependent oxidoreductase
MATTRPVELAVSLSHTAAFPGPVRERYLTLARAAEAAGVDQLVFTDHVVLADVITGHPGSEFPFPSDEEYPDPLVALAAIGAVTSRVRLGTHLFVAPLRPAVLVAKMIATLDVMSGGRLTLTVGTGWQAREFAALGVPHAGRGRRLEDIVRACFVLWNEPSASFSSPTVSFDRMYCRPQPIQPGGVPIWFGGAPTRLTARRVAELGQGWVPIGNTPIPDVAAGMALIAEECARVERDSDDLTYRCSLTVVKDSSGKPNLDRTLATASQFVEIGATMIQLPPLAHFTSRVDEVEGVLRTAKSHLASL